MEQEGLLEACHIMMVEDGGNDSQWTFMSMSRTTGHGNNVAARQQQISASW